MLSLVAPVAPFPEPQVRVVSALVAKVGPEFFGRVSLEMANVVAKVWTYHTKYESAMFWSRHPSFGRESCDGSSWQRKSGNAKVWSRNLVMPDFGLESLKMPKNCRESLEMSLGPEPGYL